MELISLRVAAQTEGAPVVSATIKDDDGVTHPVTVSSKNEHSAKVIKMIADLEAGAATKEMVAAAIWAATNGVVEGVRNTIANVEGVLEGKLTLIGGALFYENERLDLSLENHLLKLIDDKGLNANAWNGFGYFLENLYMNQSPYVRTQLFKWLKIQQKVSGNITLTNDGCFIAYKGCQGDVKAPRSIHSGPGIVNGKKMNGFLPNDIGNVIEVERNYVDPDPNSACSTGLHVGTYRYASSFARGVLLSAKVNPRDVVSVPHDCVSEKVRTCKYTVLTLAPVAYTELFFDDENYDEDGYYDEDKEGAHSYN